MSIGKLITTSCDNMPIEKKVAFNSDGSITIGTCVEDAQTLVLERICEFVDIREIETDYDAWIEKECLCGEWIDVTHAHRPKYCPNCGAKVID